jgi:hypothetical protein
LHSYLLDPDQCSLFSEILIDVKMSAEDIYEIIVQGGGFDETMSLLRRSDSQGIKLFTLQDLSNLVVSNVSQLKHSTTTPLRLPLKTFNYPASQQENSFTSSSVDIRSVAEEQLKADVEVLFDYLTNQSKIFCEVDLQVTVSELCYLIISSGGLKVLYFF